MLPLPPYCDNLHFIWIDYDGFNFGGFSFCSLCLLDNYVCFWRNRFFFLMLPFLHPWLKCTANPGQTLDSAAYLLLPAPGLYWVNFYCSFNFWNENNICFQKTKRFIKIGMHDKVFQTQLFSGFPLHDILSHKSFTQLQ